MANRNILDIAERDAGGYWTSPALDFLTTSADQNFVTSPRDLGLGVAQSFARAVKANANVTFNLTRVGAGGTPQAITLAAGERLDAFFSAIDTISGGTVTILF